MPIPGPGSPPASTRARILRLERILDSQGERIENLERRVDELEEELRKCIRHGEPPATGGKVYT